MTNPESSAAVDRLIYRQRDLLHNFGLSRNAIERLMTEGALKPPIRLGPRSKGWLAKDIQAFLDRREAERDAKDRPERPCA